MFSRFASFLMSAGRSFAARFDQSPIESVSVLETFVQTRAAYVAQTALFGYLKTRMGTRFRVYFEDDKFAPVIQGAAIQVFVACAADLTVFAVATAGREGGLSADESAKMARRCFRAAIAVGVGPDNAKNVSPEAFEQFDARVGRTLWANAASGEAAFSESPGALVRHAPVIEEFKDLDNTIVRNSIRFRWADIREQLRKRIDAAAICADWRARALDR